MAQIVIYNSGRRVARTSRAFQLTMKYELMRERTLEFSVVNVDAARPYIIDPNAIYEYKGQKYDMVTYKQTSGTNNVTTVSGYHVLLRSKNYSIPTGYAFVGTLPAIIDDMLTVSGGNAEFSVGTCVDIGTKSFSLGNTQAMTLYDALYALRALGCEIYFDNFIINTPARLGSNTGKVFRFGRDLCSLERSYDKTSDPITKSYAITIANLQRLPGGSHGDELALGDTVGIRDDLIGDQILNERITTIEEHDDPTQDKVGIGDFALDIGDTVATMQLDTASAKTLAESAQAKADGSVQQGEQYNNVSISHENGFMAVSADGTLKTENNAKDGYVIKKYYNGQWIVVWQAESSTGKTVAYNLDHTQKVEMGGSTGVGIYKKNDSGDWELIGGQDSDGSSITSKIMLPGNPNSYGAIGQKKDSDGTVRSGLFLYDNNELFARIIHEFYGLYIYPGPTDDTIFWIKDDQSHNETELGYQAPGTFLGLTEHNFTLRLFGTGSEWGIEIDASHNTFRLIKGGAVVAEW